MFRVRTLNVRSLAITSAFVALAASAGCGQNGVPRNAVWGSVTWKGQPVPRGVIYISPDTTKGNSGPQGYALIKDGHYDTRDEHSKGCSAGPQIAVVQGCDGQGISPARPYGNSLFAPFEIPIEVAPKGSQADLKTPDSVAPAATTTTDRE